MRCALIRKQKQDRAVTGQLAPSKVENDRGDVPGWVMITVMTAILVVAIMAVFKGAIVSAVQQAISNVQSAGN